MPAAETVTRPTDPPVDPPDHREPDPSVPGAVEAAEPPAQTPVAITPATVQAATFEALMAKARRRDEVIVHTVNDDGEAVELKVVLQALDGPAFDKLTDAYPPTSEQAQKGALVNGKRFTPALLAACAVSPVLTMAQWTQLQENPNWAGGEINHLFNAAWRLCNGGLDVTFTVTD